MMLSTGKNTSRYIFSLALAIALLILVNGGFAYWQMHQVKQEFHEVANRDLPLATQLLPLIDRQFEQTLLIEKLHQLQVNHRVEVVNLLQESFVRTGKKFSDTSASLEQFIEPMLQSDREATRMKMKRVKKLLGQIVEEHSQYQGQVLRMIDNMREHNNHYDKALIDLLAKEEQDLTRELISLRDELQQFTQDSAHAVEKHEAWIMKGLVLFTLFVFSLGAIMLLLIRQVMKSRDAALEEIEHFATFDPLTELFNRRAFFQRLDQSIQQAKREQQPLSLCVCDLDFFKQVNDTLGHQAGDKVLVEFGALLKNSKRASDIAGRFGGDEFVVCFPNTHAKDVVPVLENIRSQLEKKQFKEGKDEVFSVTSTFGVAELDFDNPTEEALLEAADSALYRAKELGRNKVVHL